MPKAKTKSTPLAARLLPEERAKLLLTLTALDATKAERPMLFDVTARETFTDYIVVCHGSSDRHVDAIAESVQKALKSHGHLPIGIEGREKSVWILLDYGGLVVHVFHEPLRDFYDVDGLWADSPAVDVAALLFEMREAEKKALSKPAEKISDKASEKPKKRVVKKTTAKAVEPEAAKPAPRKRATKDAEPEAAKPAPRKRATKAAEPEVVKPAPRKRATKAVEPEAAKPAPRKRATKAAEPEAAKPAPRKRAKKSDSV